MMKWSAEMWLFILFGFCSLYALHLVLSLALTSFLVKLMWTPTLVVAESGRCTVSCHIAERINTKVGYR